MKKLRRSLAGILATVMTATTIILSPSATAASTATDFITSKTDIDAILKTPYVDAVPTAHSELLFATHSAGYGFDANSVYSTGATVSHDMMIDLNVNGSNIKPDSGYYYPSYTSLEDNHKSDSGSVNLAFGSRVSATYTYSVNLPEYTTDGIISYDANPLSHWATWRSPNNSDVLTYDFNNVCEVSSVNIHYFTDRAGTPLPSDVVIKYWNGSEYVEVQNASYPVIAERTANVCTFDTVITDSIAIEFTRAESNKGMGVSEVEIYGKPLDYFNVARLSKASATYHYSYTSGSGNLVAYKPEFTIDGDVTNTDMNRWASWKSPNNTDTLTYELNYSAAIDKIKVYYLTDHGGTLFPSDVCIKYWNGTEYAEVQNAVYPEIVENIATTYTFDAVTTDKVIIELTRAASNKGMAVGEVEIFGRINGNIAPFSKVSATYHYSYTSGSGNLVAYKPEFTIDGDVTNTDMNRWASWKSPNNTDTLAYDFDYNAIINKINVYYLTDHGGTLFPSDVCIKYWNGTEYAEVQNAVYPEIVENVATTYTFDAVTTDKVIIELTRDASNKGMAVGEVEIFGKPVIYAGPYDVTVSEKKFITTDNVATSVITVKNNADYDAEIAINVTNSRGVTTDFQDGLYVVMSSNGALRRRAVLKAGESAEFISTLAFAKTEAEAKSNGEAVIADRDRLKNHKGKYLEWFKNNVPFFECDDPQITQTYYFRWLTYRNHIRLVPNDMYIVTEFMPDMGPAYNSSVAAIAHEFSEGRWVKDSKYLESYMDFWFETDGVNLTSYTNSMANSYYSYYLASGDKETLIKHLDHLISVYEMWENKTASENAYFDADTGLYFVKNGYDAMEYSLSYKIGGTDAGYRPTVNCDMYADAMAIAKIAALAGKTDIAEEYFSKAEALKKSIQQKMWDAEDGMFETYDAGDAGTIGVKELVGYIPWYYNMPDDSEEYGCAWQYLTDENTFYGVYGLTTGDKSHPDYNTYYTDSSLNRLNRCNWDGSSWPFGTTQTLVAAANALNNYDNAELTADDYFKTLKAYTNGQYKNGYSWVGENLDADTGEWYIDHAYRSYHYNHSGYADLIITGLVGLRPDDNDTTVVINPLVPDDTLNSFVLENVNYRGNNITVVYDKTGVVYDAGKGLTVYVNGKVADRSDDISKLTVSLATHTEHAGGNATCTDRAVCSICGDPYGDLAEHKFENYISDNNATCQKDCTETSKCKWCDETNTRDIADSKADHKFGEYVSDNNATCCKDGTKTAKCKWCDVTDTVTDKDSVLGHIDTTKVFKDVQAGKWYVDAINYNYTHKFIAGVETDRFGVDGDVTRGMFITILARIAGVDTTNNNVTTKFTDVETGKYFTNAIKWASENKIVAGISDSEFAPGRAIERQQLCVMIVNFAKHQKIELKAVESAISFKDAATIGNYAKDAAAICQKADIVNGYANGNGYDFRPTNTATRSEAAQILYKFHKDFEAK